MKRTLDNLTVRSINRVGGLLCHLGRFATAPKPVISWNFRPLPKNKRQKEIESSRGKEVNGQCWIVITYFDGIKKREKFIDVDHKMSQISNK